MRIDVEHSAMVFSMLAAAGPAGAVQEGKVPPQAVQTVQDAIKALEKPRGKSGSGRRMEAIPASDPANWFSPDNYPPAALRAARQGRVVVDLGIDSAGAVVSCAVKVSSGTTVLDDGTCAVARDKGRFNPATDARGRPTVGHYLMPVRWVLPDTPPVSRDIASFPKHDGYAFEVFFSAEGTLASCRTIEKSVLSNTDPCARMKIGEQGGLVTRDGKPVPYRIVRRFVQDVAIDD